MGTEVQVEEVGSLDNFIKQADKEEDNRKELQKKAAKTDQQNFGFR